MSRITFSLGTKKEIKELTRKIFRLKDIHADFSELNVKNFFIRTDEAALCFVMVIIDSQLNNYAQIQNVAKSDKGFVFELIINPKYIKSEKGLYNIIFHELLHITDPEITTQQSKEYLNYNSDSDENYYGSSIEFRAFTNEFMEAFYNEILNELNFIENKDGLVELKDIIKNIIQYMDKGGELSNKANNLIINMSGEDENYRNMIKILDKIEKKHPKFAHLTEPIGNKEEYPEYLSELLKIKKYNKKKWNSFIEKLNLFYKDIENVIDQSDFS